MSTKPNEKVVFPEISSRSWEHPADRAAMNALRNIPGLPELVKFVVGLTGESSLRLLFLSSAVRANDRQFSRVYHLVKEACRILDHLPVPEVYIAQNPVMNAGAVGVDKAFITLNSAIVQGLDDEELLGVIGHELGHIASGHVLYKTLLWVLVNAGSMFVPLNQAVVMIIVLALREWDRKSELSADRAGLLVSQDPKVSFRILMKLAGGTAIDQMDLDSFIEQAEEYDAAGNILDSVHKLLNLLGQTHPFPVLRLNELKNWSDSEAYKSILDGNYARRKQEDKEEDSGKNHSGPFKGFESFGSDFESAQREYQEEMKRSKDPLAQLLAGLGGRLESAAEAAKKTFEDLMKGPKE